MTDKEYRDTTLLNYIRAILELQLTVNFCLQFPTHHAIINSKHIFL